MQGWQRGSLGLDLLGQDAIDREREREEMRETGTSFYWGLSPSPKKKKGWSQDAGSEQVGPGYRPTVRVTCRSRPRGLKSVQGNEDELSNT